MYKRQYYALLLAESTDKNKLPLLPCDSLLNFALDYYGDDDREKACLLYTSAAGYYRDFLDTKWLYEQWRVGQVNPKEELPEGNPGLLGGMFAVWNDHCGNGVSQQDVPFRTFPAAQMCIRDSNIIWLESYFNVVIGAGFLLFPIVLLIVYFDLSPQIAPYFIGFVIIIAKILLFYKCFSNFFTKFYGAFHLILYFCALEILPDFVLWKGIILDVYKRQ